MRIGEAHVKNLRSKDLQPLVTAGLGRSELLHRDWQVVLAVLETMPNGRRSD